MEISSSSAIAGFTVFILTLCIHLPVTGLGCGILAFGYGMWNLVPWSGIEPGPPALRAQSLDHWTMRLSSPSVQFHSVTQSDLILFNPMDSSTPGFPVHHLLEFAQTHVHRVGDAIQPSHPLLSPSPPTFDLSQHQGLFKWVSFSHQATKLLEFQLQHQSFQWIFRTNFL